MPGVLTTDNMVRTEWLPSITPIFLNEEQEVRGYNNDGDIYHPTDDEVKYPDLYVRNHNFHCRDKSPMIVGEWAEKFKEKITNKLVKMRIQ